MQPYPGDSEFLQVGVRHHFEVFAQPNSDLYWIYDHLTCQDCMIWSGNLKNPYFHLGEWYACWRSRKNRSTEHPKRPWTMGNTYGYNAMLVLCSGIPTLYPTVNPEINNEFRISVVQKNEDQYFLDLGNWYCTKRLPKALKACNDDLIIYFSIFTPKKTTYLSCILGVTRILMKKDLLVYILYARRTSMRNLINLLNQFWRASRRTVQMMILL